MKRWVKDVYIQICKRKININLLYVRRAKYTGKFIGAGHNTGGPWTTTTHSIVKLKDALKELDK